MIKRYSNPEMEAIWTDESKFQAFLDVEIATVKAWVELGEIPKSDYNKIKKNAKFSVKRIETL